MPVTRLMQLLLCLAYFMGTSVSAGTFTVNVTDNGGERLGDAVVELIPTAKTATTLPTSKHYEMRQQNRVFSPFVLAVPQGAQVDFPNLDRTRHHVYSFSEAKQFELKLYVGQAESPISFEKPGLVAIGCNIHDYMQAFIYVAASPYFAVSNETGLASIDNIPDGEYQIRLWHPWQLADPAPTTIMINDANNHLTVNIDVKREEKPSSPPSGFGVQHHVSTYMGQHAK